jgi:hypothetical protein
MANMKEELHAETTAIGDKAILLDQRPRDVERGVEP